MDLHQRHEGHTEVKADQYWALGYSFETLNDEQKHQRREYLDWYGFTAQWSVLVVFAVIQGSIAISYLIQSGLKYDTPKSPSFTRRVTTKLGWLRKLHSWGQQWRWWVRKSMLPWGNWGTRGEWIGASLWTVWLLYLCVAQTGNDYLHLTKRFGQIGASQLPFLYLLAMRAPYSLAQYLTNRSHEQLKSAHQILARIIFLLFILHGAFYFNFFVLSGFLPKRIKDRDVIFGIISIALFAAIGTTALGFIRRRNYRLFYTTHIVIVNLIIVPLYLHVSHIHIFVYEILVVEALHLLFRALRLKTYDGTVKILPGTNLVQVRIPLPAASSALKWKPGQHVYLSRPKANATTPKLYEQWLNTVKTNPFTIASLPAKDKELMLVARTLNGNTKYLAELARSLAQGGSNIPMLPTAGGDIPILPISLEGPYGGSRWLPDLSDYDRVLLVAGGVGATFILPVYRSLLEGHATTPAGTHIRCIWAVQKISETQWAFPAGLSEDEHSNGDAAAATENGLLHGSTSVEVYVTRPSGPSLQVDPSAEGVFTVDPEDAEEYELQESEQLLSMEEQMEKPKKGMVIKSGRPPIADVVDDVCSKGMRTAVICCGPPRLTEDIRRNVEGWVKKGHDIFWYDETFGW